jgi:hypothetical protein
MARVLSRSVLLGCGLLLSACNDFGEQPGAPLPADRNATPSTPTTNDAKPSAPFVSGEALPPHVTDEIRARVAQKRPLRAEQLARGVDRGRAMPLPNGDLETSITLRGGTTEKIVTLGEARTYRAIARGLAADASVANQIRLHRALRAHTTIAEIDGAPLPSNEDLGNLSADELLSLNRRLADAHMRRAALTAPTAPTAPSAPPSADGDQMGSSNGDGVCIPGATRVWLPNIPLSGIPQRPYVSKVKRQASRGTCTAFALTSAIETSYNQIHGELRNLSEQHLYATAEYYWTGNNGLYGINLETTAEESEAQSYKWRWETQWEYNSSQTCTDYTGPCSNTVHQFPFLLGTYYDPVSGSNANVEADYIGELDTVSSNLTALKMAVAINYSLVVAIDVTANFGQNVDGVVAYPDTSTVGGGHALHVLGYVDNANLPTGMPQGSGGGYFVVKNSWGCAFGDEGYAYLPYDWVWAFGNFFVVVTSK